MMPLFFSVDVVMERVPLVNRWVSEQWQPAAVIPQAEGKQDAGPPECIEDGAERAQWKFPRMAIELHPSEAEGYFLNLTSPAPVVFVMWREEEEGGPAPVRPHIVTLSYNQAGRFMDGGERVDPVPMPDVLREWLAAYVAQHYKPEPKRKVRRNDPFKDGAFVRDPLPEEREP
jgi:hypothetical protein